MTSRQLVRLVREAALSKKAREVLDIDLRGKSTLADFFIICEGDTDRQTRAIADGIREAAKARGIAPLHTVGEDAGSWILVDDHEDAVPIFLPGERACYDLESLWTAEPMVEMARR